MNKAIPYLLVALLGLALLGVVGYASVKGLTDLAQQGYDPGGDGYDDEGTAGSASFIVLYADTWPTPMAAPAYFHAPLARDARGLLDSSDRHPPPWYVAVELSHGELEAQRELLVAMRESADRGASAEELRTLYREMLYGWTTAEHCAWLRTLVEAPERIAMWDDAWIALSHCADPDTRALFVDRDDLVVPAPARIEHASHAVVAGTARWSAELEAALVTVARQGSLLDVELGAKTLLAIDPVRSGPALSRARAATNHADVRQTLDRWRAAPPPRALGPADADLDALVRTPGKDLEIIASEIGSRREALLRALVRCAVGEDDELPETAHLCLKAVARLDRSMAVATARTIVHRGIDEPRLVEAATALGDYPGTEALVAHMSDLELVGFEARSPVVLADIDAYDVLRSRRRALCVDERDEESPAQNDALAQRLAFLARPALVGALFVQQPAWLSTPGALHAYDRGNLWTTPLENESGPDFYDAVAVLGLLNTMLRERGSQTRLVLMDAGASICAVAGKEPALRQLENEDLITLEWWTPPTPTPPAPGAGGG